MIDESQPVFICNLVAKRHEVGQITFSRLNRRSTERPSVKPHSSSEISPDDVRTLLRNAGLRCTAARIAIIQCLKSAAGPLTPVEVAEFLQDYGFDKSTIYRSLTELNEAGIAARLDLGDSVRRFEMSGTDRDGISDHPHFMCMDCGEVVCLADFTVEIRQEKKRGRHSAVGVFSEVLVRGHCRRCLS